MDQYLVNDDLEEDRRDQRKDLRKERGEQHLRQETAVFPDGTQEPRG